MNKYLGLVSFLFGLTMVSALSMAAPSNTKELFRYTNKNGNPVIDSIIPAEYVAGGYDVISTRGKLIRVVPPARTAEANAKAAALQQSLDDRKKADLQLRRSYSSVEDIEAAKQRNLQTLRANIVILENNLSTVNKRLVEARANAASIERGGKDAPDSLLKSIAGFEQETRDLTLMMDLREKELATLEEKFEEDKLRFIEITQAIGISGR